MNEQLIKSVLKILKELFLVCKEIENNDQAYKNFQENKIFQNSLNELHSILKGKIHYFALKHITGTFYLINIVNNLEDLINKLEFETKKNKWNLNEITQCILELNKNTRLLCRYNFKIFTGISKQKYNYCKKLGCLVSSIENPAGKVFFTLRKEEAIIHSQIAESEDWFIENLSKLTSLANKNKITKFVYTEGIDGLVEFSLKNNNFLGIPSEKIVYLAKKAELQKGIVLELVHPNLFKLNRYEDEGEEEVYTIDVKDGALISFKFLKVA